MRRCRYQQNHDVSILIDMGFDQAHVQKMLAGINFLVFFSRDVPGLHVFELLAYSGNLERAVVLACSRNLKRAAVRQSNTKRDNPPKKVSKATHVNESKNIVVSGRPIPATTGMTQEIGTPLRSVSSDNVGNEPTPPHTKQRQNILAVLGQWMIRNNSLEIQIQISNKKLMKRKGYRVNDACGWENLTPPCHWRAWMPIKEVEESKLYSEFKGFAPVQRASKLLGSRLKRVYPGFGTFGGVVVAFGLRDDADGSGSNHAKNYKKNKRVFFLVEYDNGVKEYFTGKELESLVEASAMSLESARASAGVGDRVENLEPFSGTLIEKPILFSFALFRSSSHETYLFYRDSTIDFIHKTKLELKTSRYLVHINEKMDEKDLQLLAKAAKGDIQFRRYSLGKKIGSQWVLCAMRFSALWEHTGTETVVVVDVHDEVRTMLSEIYKIVHKLAIARKEVGLTYWESDEPTCVNKIPLPVPVPVHNSNTSWSKQAQHCHTDGGLCVWMAGECRTVLASCPGDFLRMVERVVQCIGKVPHGADELLLDAFLYSNKIAEMALLFPHEHRIRDQREKVSVLKQLVCLPDIIGMDITNVKLNLGGWQSKNMYVCSEVQEENSVKEKLWRAELSHITCSAQSRIKKSKKARHNEKRVCDRHFDIHVKGAGCVICSIKSSVSSNSDSETTTEINCFQSQVKLKKITNVNKTPSKRSPSDRLRI